MGASRVFFPDLPASCTTILGPAPIKMLPPSGEHAAGTFQVFQ
jgi:hypothetical protein